MFPAAPFLLRAHLATLRQDSGRTILRAYGERCVMTDNTTPISDIVALERAAIDELDAEANKAATKQIRDSLKRIRDAERIVANLKLDHKALLDDLREGR